MGNAAAAGKLAVRRRGASGAVCAALAAMALLLAACQSEAPSEAADPDPAAQIGDYATDRASSPSPEASSEDAARDAAETSRAGGEADEQDEPAGAGDPHAAAPPELADTPEALADQLERAEELVRDPARGERELAETAWVQQRAYRRLGADAELRAAVLTALPERWRVVARSNARASVELAALTSPQEELPNWRLVAPAPRDELLGYYREAEQAFGVGWEYLAAIHLVETRMSRIEGQSPAGAQGPMQFIPSTWEAYGEGDINEDRDAILAAGRYLAANGAPEDMERALRRYNPSDHYVAAITAYAEQLRADAAAYRGYYHWQVYYRTPEGDLLLPVGFPQRPPLGPLTP